MGKRTVISFVYVGMFDWLIRIPYSGVAPGGTITFYHEYMNKKEYTFRQVIDRRQFMMEQLEKDGLRFPPTGNWKGKHLTAAMFALKDKRGDYDHLC